MGQQAQVLSGSLHKEKEQSAVRWRILIPVTGMTLLALLALAVLIVTPTGKPATLLEDVNLRFVTNPELMIVRRYAASVAWNSESSFLAANPELMVARRYTGSVQSESGFLADNPELMVARRYAGFLQPESGFLAANPELMVARRYATPVAWSTESGFLAANPELMVARRYARLGQSESSFLAVNPELMIFRRYSGTLPGNARSVPSGRSQ